jgi:methylthioribose-1-phosphate isomerase
MVETIIWRGDRVLMLDQRKLPWQTRYYTCRSYRDVAKAIKTMVIRGAPAIGIAAAMGVALGARAVREQNVEGFLKKLDSICQVLRGSRPTAVNLGWAVNRMQHLAHSLGNRPLAEIKAKLEAEAQQILEEDIAINRLIGRVGQALIPPKATILTHCNAGALATGGYGTALGVVRAAVEAGKHIHVLADETRPFLQGARLTVWELMQDNIPATLIADNAAGAMIKNGEVQVVIVGADRVAANGDVANKVGTYSLAVLAKENKVPFYVAAPLSTVDLLIENGDQIPIEERPQQEVTTVFGKSIAPQGVQARNPAFDVTPHRYVTGIITEKGVVRRPYTHSLKRLFSSD